MSHLLSDEDSTDSDSGIRFKTETTRKPQNEVTFRTNQRLTNTKNVEERSHDSHRSSYPSHSRQHDRSADRKFSRDRHRRSRSKEHYWKRSKSREKIRFNRSRSKSREDRYKRSKSSEKERYKRSISREKNTTNRHNTDKFREYKNDDKKYHVKNHNNHDKIKKIDNDSLKNEDMCSLLALKKLSSISESSNSDSEVNKSEPSFSENGANQKTDTFGPVLPSTIKKDNIKLHSEDQNYGPKMHQKNGNNTTIGPIILLDTNKSSQKLNLATNEANLCKSLIPPKSKSENESYGPALPSSSSKNSDESESESQCMYGPSLPTHLTKSTKTEISEINNDTFGPSLPPNLQKQSTNNKNKIMGPSLPPHLLEKLKNDLQDEEPILEQKEDRHESEDSDDDMIGPLPEGHSSTNVSHKLLEERALELRINALNPVDTAPKREEWMTALPDVHRVNLGLGPRQFRSKEGPDLSDRSSWTDTPDEKEKKSKKEKKIDIKEKSKLEHIAKRDKEQEEIVKKHKKKKKRDKSLIELHQEKLAKKKKEESSMPLERRPFDRDIDLKVNRFDEAQKKAILKKAQLLDTRFSTGESKFL